MRHGVENNQEKLQVFRAFYMTVIWTHDVSLLVDVCYLVHTEVYVWVFFHVVQLHL